MSETAHYLTLLQSVDRETFLFHTQKAFLVRQRLQEIEEGAVHFQTPLQVPVVNLDTLPTSRSSRESSSQGVRALRFTCEEDLVRHFAVHPIERSRRNQFSQGVTVGRAANNDIILPVRTVSKFHAWIAEDAGRYWCHDAKSSYGTIVDRVVLREFDRLPLYPGSKIEIGEVHLTFVDAAGLYQWLTARLALVRR